MHIVTVTICLSKMHLIKYVHSNPKASRTVNYLSMRLVLLAKQFPISKPRRLAICPLAATDHFAMVTSKPWVIWPNSQVGSHIENKYRWHMVDLMWFGNKLVYFFWCRKDFRYWPIGHTSSVSSHLWSLVASDHFDHVLVSWLYDNRKFETCWHHISFSDPVRKQHSSADLASLVHNIGCFCKPILHHLSTILGVSATYNIETWATNVFICYNISMADNPKHIFFE
jgi:hypothetical protein